MKLLKKNQVIIYVIAIMLMTAGYLNYTSNENNNTVETYSENIANIGDAVLVSNNDVNDIQLANIPCISFTFETSQLDILPLKAVPSNK